MAYNVKSRVNSYVIQRKILAGISSGHGNEFRRTLHKDNRSFETRRLREGRKREDGGGYLFENGGKPLGKPFTRCTELV